MQYVPRTLLKAYSIKLKPDVVLRDQNDKLWPVKVSFKDDGSVVLATGWERFRRKNVKVGQTCRFVCVFGRGNICKEMQVRIIRGSARDRKGNRKVQNLATHSYNYFTRVCGLLYVSKRLWLAGVVKHREINYEQLILLATFGMGD